MLSLIAVLRVGVPTVLFSMFASSVLGVTLSTSLTAPTENVFESFPALGDPSFGDSFVRTFRWIDNSVNGAASGHLSTGQTFLVPASSDVVLDAITLRVREFGTSVIGQPYTLEIYHFPSVASGTGDALVSSQSGIFPNDIPPSSLLASNPRFWSFDVQNVPLTAGETYGFLVSFDSGPDPERFVNFVINFSDAYPNGRDFYKFNTPLEWGFGGGLRDAQFYLQSVPPAPEPSAFLLLGLGAFGLVRHTQRRRRR